jgi:threonine/homoserine/homoserine lactone efflux protein
MECKDSSRTPQIAIRLPDRRAKIARMDTQLLIALAGFALATSVTPGPNNMMLLASGVNFGFARTLPHMAGISLGHALMVFLVGLGLAGALQASPVAMLVLKLASAAYMLWLAWKIANAAAPQGRAAGRPFGFGQAAAFQWVNPKAWAMAVTATTVYAPAPGWQGMAAVAVVFALVNFPSVAVWAAMGQGLRRWLDAPGRLRAFNITMAVLLVASLWPVLRM